MPYKHTQIGYLMIGVMCALGVYFGGILVFSGFDQVVAVVSAVVFVILASFATLTVTIDGSDLRIKFGYGIYSKRFTLREIASAEAVRNHWYFGWGIRLWMKPKMWILNVSGLDAVEIKMKNGKIYRIGTDEPKKLEQAVNQMIQ